MLWGQFRVNAMFINPFLVMDLRNDPEVLQDLANHLCTPILTKEKQKLFSTGVGPNICTDNKFSANTYAACPWATPE